MYIQSIFESLTTLRYCCNITLSQKAPTKNAYSRTEQQMSQGRLKTKPQTTKAKILGDLMSPITHT